MGLANITVKFDKFVHYSVFYLMTLIFYHCFDTKNVSQLKLLTFTICTLCGGIGSEFVQSILPYRTFDYKDILMNVLGSLSALATSEVYARYMVRRRRLKRLEIIKSIGDEAETLAETINQSRNSGSYSYSYDSSTGSNRTSMSGPYYEEDDTNSNNYSDYFSEDLESGMGGAAGSGSGSGSGSAGRGRRNTTSIELKNVAPIALNQLEDEVTYE